MSGEQRPSASFLGVLGGALNRNVLLLVGSGTIFSVPLGFLFVAAPVYLERLPGIPTALIGLFFTVRGLVAVAFIIPVGILADRFGRRAVLALGGFLAAAALVLLAYLDTLEGLLAVAALLGLAEALYFSTWNALLADASSSQTRTTVFGLSFFATSVALAGGSLLGSLADRAVQAGASPQEAYQPLFLLLGPLLLAVPLFMPLVSLPRITPAGSRSLLPRRSFGVIGRFFASNVVIGLGAGILIPLFSLWFLLQFSAGEAFTGPLFAVSSVVNAFAFLAAPFLARRAGMIRAVVLAQASSILILVAMPFSAGLGSPGLMLAAVLFVARNALMNMTWPVMSSFLMGAVNPEERAAASAVTGASFRLPFALTTTLGSYLLSVDLSLPFFVTAALYTVGTGAFWYFFREYEGATPEEAVAAQVAEAARPK